MVKFGESTLEASRAPCMWTEGTLVAVPHAGKVDSTSTPSKVVPASSSGAGQIFDIIGGEAP